MTRQFLKATTALALGLSMTAPNSILAASADARAIRLAQASGQGETGQARGKDAPNETAEVCADDSETVCVEEGATEDPAEDPAAKGEAQSADAPGQARKQTRDAETATDEASDDAAAEEKPSDQAADSAGAPDDAGEDPEEKPGDEMAAESGSEEQSEDMAEAEEAEPGKPEDVADGSEAEGDDDVAADPDGMPTEDVPAETERESAEDVAADGAPEDDEEIAEEDAPEQATEQTEETGTAEETGTEGTDTEETVSDTSTSEERSETTPAAAADDENAEPVEVISETVTEETTRTSDEEVDEARAERQEATGSTDDDDDDLIKILGAAAGGIVAGMLLNEALGGGEVVENTGDRVVVRRGDEYFVRKDENEILRRPGSDVRTERFRDGSSRTVVERQDGVRVVTIRDAGGYVVRRSRIMPDGREIVIFDDTWAREEDRDARVAEVDLPRYDRTQRHRRYVDYSATDESRMRDVLMTRPTAELDRRYTLRQVRENEPLRDVMPRLDLDTITFDLGSAAITRDQARLLDRLGWAMQDILIENPDEVFLIEGHTDAVGSPVDNLLLSDRRAEAVALALTEYHDIPPENLITQGYGEEYLKVETLSAERANRRAAVRRITPLLDRTVRR